MQDPELILSVIDYINIAVGLVALVLGLVALIVTVIGFLASLWFYQKGVDLQTSANDTLVTIREKTGALEGHIGGMSEKMLAAIIERDRLSSDFAAINEQIEQASQEIKEAALREIGAAGDEERERISAVVDEQVSRVRRVVTKTQESAEEAISERAVEGAGPIRPDPFNVQRSRIQNYVVNIGLRLKKAVSETEFEDEFFREVPFSVTESDIKMAKSVARIMGVIRDDIGDEPSYAVHE